MDVEYGCLLSHPAHPHKLSLGFKRHLELGCFTCGEKYTVASRDCFYYYCTTCGVDFHGGCHQRPRSITHPYHLQHPLTLFHRDAETGIISNIIPDAYPEESDATGQESDTTDQGKCVFVEIIQSKTDIMFQKCTWCSKDLNGDWFYRCLICSFCLDLSCAETFPLLTIPYPKNHSHSLVFFPRPVLTPCDARGLVNVSEPSYVCFQCNYVAHRSCINLPGVIKITRHPHRLSRTPYRSPVASSCRICYKDVDIKYGQYSCVFEDCPYVAHSTCATHENVWDGTELEWETEEVDEAEDVASFKKLGEGLIEHFCHEHPLSLKNNTVGVGDIVKQCEACVFPIVSPQFYHCQECDYSLHEVCAGLPRKLDHALHNHTLTLAPFSTESWISYYCSACSRAYTGFRFDKHLLTLSCGGEIDDDLYWCEVCEKQLDPRIWFYARNECCTTVHLQCIFGSSYFMKPGSIFDMYKGEVEVFRNGNNTRPFCYECLQRCTSSIYYVGYMKTLAVYNHSWIATMVFCSLECQEETMRKRRTTPLPDSRSWRVWFKKEVGREATYEEFVHVRSNHWEEAERKLGRVARGKASGSRIKEHALLLASYNEVIRIP